MRRDKKCPEGDIYSYGIQVGAETHSFVHSMPCEKKKIIQSKLLYSIVNADENSKHRDIASYIASCAITDSIHFLSLASRIHGTACSQKRK